MRLWCLVVLFFAAVNAIQVHLRHHESAQRATAVQAASWADLQRHAVQLGAPGDHQCFVDGERTMLRDFEELDENDHVTAAPCGAGRPPTQGVPPNTAAPQRAVARVVVI